MNLNIKNKVEVNQNKKITYMQMLRYINRIVQIKQHIKRGKLIRTHLYNESFSFKRPLLEVLKFSSVEEVKNPMAFAFNFTQNKKHDLNFL